MTPVLGIIVPCYNEEAVIGSSAVILHEYIGQLIVQGVIHNESFIAFVDDGSTDGTVNNILSVRRDSSIRIIRLSANVGHQAALLAGLHYAADRTDCCVSIDADLQDDFRAIEAMVRKFLSGSDIVYGVRLDRTSDSFFKRTTAQIFYRIMKVFGVSTIYNHGDFRLMSRRVLHEIRKYKEVNLFLRATFPLMGFPSSTVEYTRSARTAGVSKYPIWKMIKFAVTGITSFTNYPLKLITAIGSIIFLGSLCAAMWVLWVVAVGKNVPGWASITLPIYFLGGIQLLALGIIGEYLSKVYMETKARPHYHIEQVIESTTDLRPELKLDSQTGPFLHK